MVASRVLKLQYQRIIYCIYRGATSSPASFSTNTINHHHRCLSTSRTANKSHLLNDQQTQLLREQRDILNKVQHLAEQANVEYNFRDSVHLLSNVPVDDVDAAFSMVIAGEFNVGKSTFINALLGQKLLETGILPTTDAVTLITGSSSMTVNDDKDAVKQHQEVLPNGFILHRVNKQASELLKDLVLVDTPGLNAVALGHEEMTRRMLPAADLIVFITSSDRPFAESERQFLQSIQPYRKRIVVVVNKIDTLESLGSEYGKEEKKKVEEFVASNCAALLGARPVVFVVSGRNALEAKLRADSAHPSLGSGAAMWKRSGFEELEGYFLGELTADAKVMHKLLSPLGFADGATREILESFEKEKEAIDVDRSTLSLLESQMEAWTKDLERDLAFDRAQIIDAVGKWERQISGFFDEAGILQELSMSMNRDEFDAKWEQLGLDSVQKSVDEILEESSSMVAGKAKTQGQSVIEYLGKRPVVKRNDIIGNVIASSSFDNTCQNLLTKLTRSVHDALDTFDIKRESDSLYQSLRNTTAMITLSQSSLLSISALACYHDLIDLYVCIAGTSMLSISGLFALPHIRKRKIVSDLRRKLSHLAERLDAEILEISDREIVSLNRRIVEGVAPYSRFVKSETERLQRLRDECEDVLSESHSLRSRIKKTHGQ
mmetsp:Transcript_10490/g.15585  ORF Transcript_10490/g.15585 Transcript_10490/m.15585 type:complete len:662 (-) Transcript_10490:307-2292(-)